MRLVELRSPPSFQHVLCRKDLTMAPAPCQDLPRYKLSVGQHARYLSNIDFKNKWTETHTETRRDAIVVGENDDGRVHLILGQKSKMTRFADGKPEGAPRESSE